MPPADQTDGTSTVLLPEKYTALDLVEFEASEQSSTSTTALPVICNPLTAFELVERMQALPVTVTGPTARATIGVGVDRKSFASSSGSVVSR